MMSFYAMLETKYKPVPQNGQIETLNFLEASRLSILPLLDMLGKNTFAMVRIDVNGNITKLRKKYDENPEDFHTLVKIIEYERNNDLTNQSNSATDALLWLTRGLHFICLFITNLSNDASESEDIKPCISQAYESSLKQHHGWIIQKAVQVAFLALPYRKDLLAMLRRDASEDSFRNEVQKYQAILQQHVNAIQDMYTSWGLDPKPLTT